MTDNTPDAERLTVTEAAEQISCPRCLANPGSPCLGTTRPHRARYEARASQASASPEGADICEKLAIKLAHRATAHRPCKATNDSVWDISISSHEAETICTLLREPRASQASASPAGEVERLRDALETAANQFANYARIHAEKGTPDGRTKANTNAFYENICRAALSTPTKAVEGERERIVAWMRHPSRNNGVMRSAADAIERGDHLSSLQQGNKK